MRFLVKGAQAFLFSIAIAVESCSLVIKDDLDGLGPYPKDAGIDAPSMMRADADGSDARDGGVIVDVQLSDIFPQPDGPLGDALADLDISDRIDAVAADATSEGGGTPPDDASADAIDDVAFPDRATPDGGRPPEDASADRIDDIARSEEHT